MQNVLEEIKNTSVYYYKFKNDTDENRIYIGVISEDSPDWITTTDKKAISASAFANLLMVGMKAQQKQIDSQQMQIQQLKQEIKQLKNK